MPAAEATRQAWSRARTWLRACTGLDLVRGSAHRHDAELMVRRALRRAVLLSSEEELNELRSTGTLEWVTEALAHLLLVPGSVDEAFKRREDARARKLAEPVPVEAEDNGRKKHK